MSGDWRVVDPVEGGDAVLSFEGFLAGTNDLRRRCALAALVAYLEALAVKNYSSLQHEIRRVLIEDMNRSKAVADG